jgi:hypothetical protein
MDVYKTEDDLYSMSGQIILSMPGSPCMRCLGYLTEKKIGIEAAKYGDVGGMPQIVWANGLLASTAVGIFVDLVTGWSKTGKKSIYLAYDGNSGKLEEHIRMRFCDKICSHYKLENVGAPVFLKI